MEKNVCTYKVHTIMNYESVFHIEYIFIRTHTDTAELLGQLVNK